MNIECKHAPFPDLGREALAWSEQVYTHELQQVVIHRTLTPGSPINPDFHHYIGRYAFQVHGAMPGHVVVIPDMLFPIRGATSIDHAFKLFKNACDTDGRDMANMNVEDELNRRKAAQQAMINPATGKPFPKMDGGRG